MQNIVKIDIIVDTESLVKFFENGGDKFGSQNNPYMANNFCQVKAIGSITTGIHNVFGLQEDTSYVFDLLTPSDTYPITDVEEMYLTMIKEGVVSESDWSKIIAVPNPDDHVHNGKLIVNKDDNNLTIVTQEKITLSFNLQYSIYFSVQVGSDVKYGIIDPYIRNTTDR